MITNCPKCESTQIKKVRWTWWGGIIGPALINTTKCESCGHTFNGNTGKSNVSAIVIYSVLLLVVIIIITTMT